MECEKDLLHCELTFAQVYKGLYKGQMVAIKVLKNFTPSEEEEGINEFRKEFEIMRFVPLSRIFSIRICFLLFK